MFDSEKQAICTKQGEYIGALIGHERKRRERSGLQDFAPRLFRRYSLILL